MKLLWEFVKAVVEVVVFGIVLALLAAVMILFLWLMAVGFFYLFGMIR